MTPNQPSRTPQTSTNNQEIFIIMQTNCILTKCILPTVH